MSDRLTDKALKDIKARIDVFDEGTPQGDGTGNFRNLINDAVLLLNEIDALRARVAELESQNVQAAKVILDTRDLLEASEKYMGDNPERWFKTHLRKIVEADSYRTQRYNLNVDLNAD